MEVAGAGAGLGDADIDADRLLQPLVKALGPFTVVGSSAMLGDLLNQMS